MKRLFLILILSAVSASAQDAAFNTPVVRPSETKLAVKEINITPTQVVVSLNVQTSGGDDVRYYNVSVPNSAPATQSATVVGFITALGTARSGETGSALRRFQFRCLGYLFDTGYLPGVTLQP
jgi:hypothetical protein